jgi:hypothetical protein
MCARMLLDSLVHESRDMPTRRTVHVTGITAATGLLVLALTACAPPVPEQTDTPAPGPGATSLFPSRTPTITGTSTSTPLPPAPTATPTVTGAFLQASVYGVSRLSGHRLLVSITVPAAGTHPSILSQPYTAMVGTSTLSCEVLAKYPDRLYCSGPDPYVNYSPKAAELDLYAGDQAGPVFVTEFTIPALPTLTPTPSETPASTPTP